MIELQWDWNGLDEAIAATTRLEQYSPKTVFERYFKGYLRPALIDRYKVAAISTPYAPASIGTRKRVSGAIRGQGNDPGFGVDSRNLLRDFTGEGDKLSITDEALLLFSDLPYAAYIDSLFESKGPGAVFDATDEDQEALADQFGEYLEELFVK